MAIFTLGAALLLSLRAISGGLIRRNDWTPVHWVVVGLLCLVALGSWHAGFGFPAWRGAFYLLCWIVVFQDLRRATDGRGLNQSLLWLNTVVAALVAVLAIWQILRGTSIPGGIVSTDLPGVATLGNQNYTAGYLMVSFFPGLSLFLRLEWRSGPSLVASLLLLAILSGMVLCRSLGALAGLAVGIFCLLGMWLFQRWGKGQLRGFFAAALLAVLLGGTALGLIISDSRWVQGTIPADPGGWQQVLGNNQAEARAREWWICLQMVGENPWTGVGLNSYKAAWPHYRAAHTRWTLARRYPGQEIPSPNGPRFTRAHNEWLQILAELGLPGGLVLVAGLVALIRWLISTLGSLAPREIKHRLFMAAGLAALGVLSLVSFPWHLPATCLGAALLLAGLFPAEGNDPIPPYPVGKGKVLGGVVATLVSGLLFWVAWAEFTSDLLYRQGQEARLAGRFPEATAILRNSVGRSLWPDQALTPLGLSLAVNGDLFGAEATLRRALEIEPTYEAYVELARILGEKGEFEEAREILTLLAECYPTQHIRKEIAYNLSVLELRTGRLDLATQQSRALLDLDPQMPRAWLVKGVLERMKGQLAEAEVSLQKSAELARDQLARLPEQTGTRLQRQGELDAAEKSLAEVRALLTGTPENANGPATPGE